MLLLQHDSTGPVLCFHAIVLLKRAFPRRAEAAGEKWEGGLMSALPPKADMCGATRHVRLVPKADIPRPYCLRGQPHNPESPAYTPKITVAEITVATRTA